MNSFITLSKVLIKCDVNDTGRYDSGDVLFLFGFKRGITMACFIILGILPWIKEAFHKMANGLAKTSLNFFIRMAENRATRQRRWKELSDCRAQRDLTSQKILKRNFEKAAQGSFSLMIITF